MALGTYAELQAAVAAWLHRSDLAATIPDLIALAEARHARDLRLQPMLTTGPIATSAGNANAALPADWLEFVSLTLPALSLQIDPMGANGFAQTYAATYNAAPRHYVVRGANLVLGPTPDAIYSLTATYYARPAALSVASTNWLLTAHPGLYLWGALAEAEPFVSNDPRMALWEGKYAAELEAARRADSRATGGSLRIRAR
jgi:hypothetical protein